MAISNNPVTGSDIYSSIHIFFFDAPATDNYTFTVENVDDQVQFSIDNGSWNTAPLFGSATQTVNLVAGLHKIVLKFKQNPVGNTSMRFLLPARAGGLLPPGAGYQVPVNYSQLIGRVIQSIPNDAFGLGTLERGVRGFVYDDATTGIALDLTDTIPAPFSTFDNDGTGIIDYFSDIDGPTPVPCENYELDIDFIEEGECLKRSLAKINKNFSIIESLLISLSTCCSLDPCVCCSSSTPPPTPTPTPPPTGGPTNCNIPFSFSDGGVSYPQIFPFELGAATGTVNLFFNALQRPDRFICSIDGTVVLDTGYYGAPRYTYGSWDRANFTNRLSGLIDPITGNVYPFTDASHDIDGYPIINSAQLDNKTFSKTTSTSTCILCAFAPMLATYWEINMSCPT